MSWAGLATIITKNKKGKGHQMYIHELTSCECYSITENKRCESMFFKMKIIAQQSVCYTVINKVIPTRLQTNNKL